MATGTAEHGLAAQVDASAHIQSSTPTPVSATVPGGRASKTHEPVTWEPLEIAALLSLFKVEYRRSVNGNLKQSAWDRLARGLHAQGVMRTGQQCKDKIYNMKKKYMREAQAKMATGISKWLFYDAADDIFREPNIHRRAEAYPILHSLSHSPGIPHNHQQGQHPVQQGVMADQQVPPQLGVSGSVGLTPGSAAGGHPSQMETHPGEKELAGTIHGGEGESVQEEHAQDMEMEESRATEQQQKVAAGYLNEEHQQQQQEEQFHHQEQQLLDGEGSMTLAADESFGEGQQAYETGKEDVSLGQGAMPTVESLEPHTEMPAASTATQQDTAADSAAGSGPSLALAVTEASQQTEDPGFTRALLEVEEVEKRVGDGGKGSEEGEGDAGEGMPQLDGHEQGLDQQEREEEVEGDHGSHIEIVADQAHPRQVENSHGGDAAAAAQAPQHMYLQGEQQQSPVKKRKRLAVSEEEGILRPPIPPYPLHLRRYPSSSVQHQTQQAHAAGGSRDKGSRQAPRIAALMARNTPQSPYGGSFRGFTPGQQLQGRAMQQQQPADILHSELPRGHAAPAVPARPAASAGGVEEDEQQQLFLGRLQAVLQQAMVGAVSRVVTAVERAEERRLAAMLRVKEMELQQVREVEKMRMECVMRLAGLAAHPGGRDRGPREDEKVEGDVPISDEQAGAEAPPLPSASDGEDVGHGDGKGGDQRDVAEEGLEVEGEAMAEEEEFGAAVEGGEAAGEGLIEVEGEGEQADVGEVGNEEMHVDEGEEHPHEGEQEEEVVDEGPAKEEEEVQALDDY